MLAAVLSAAMAVPDLLLGEWTGDDGETTWQTVFKPAAVQYTEYNSSGHITDVYHSFIVNSTCHADADGISATIMATPPPPPLLTPARPARRPRHHNSCFSRAA